MVEVEGNASVEGVKLEALCRESSRNASCLRALRRSEESLGAYINQRVCEVLYLFN